ncbi:hypothetical protein B1218_34210, partial [Pseudomonas ogarae]
AVGGGEQAERGSRGAHGDDDQEDRNDDVAVRWFADGRLTGEGRGARLDGQLVAAGGQWGRG